MKSLNQFFNEKLLINKNFKTIFDIERTKALLSSGKIRNLPDRLNHKELAAGYTLVSSDKPVNELFDDIINSFITNKTYDKNSDIDDYIKNKNKIIVITLIRPKYNEIYIYKKIDLYNICKINIELESSIESKILIYVETRHNHTIDLKYVKEWADEIYEITEKDFNDLVDFIKDKNK